MKWFKFYGIEYLSDPKMLSLTACERSCWITLLSYASVSDEISETGFVKHLDEQTLMIQAGVDFKEDEWGRTVGVLKHFETLGMITNDNGVITLKKWLKRQETNLTGYERVKRCREKKRNDNVMITSEKSRVDKRREDKKREEKKESEVVTSLTLPKSTNDDFFKGGDSYRKMIGDYAKASKVSIEQLEPEFKKFVLYWTEPNSTGTKVRWQMQKTFDVKRRLYTWLSNVSKFNKGGNSKLTICPR